MTVTVRLNDKDQELPDGCTVAGLVADQYANHRWLAVAIDGEVVPRSLWESTGIAGGASLEILTAVQGG